MRKVTIVALVVLLSGAGLWYARVNRRATNTTGSTIIGNLAVNIDGASLVANQTGIRQGRFAVDGNLHARSLPNGELVLEGNVRMRQAEP